MNSWPKIVNEVHARAAEALKNSYAPYSNLHVACAVKLKTPSLIVTGVNVENASYGGTICAERSAIVSAVSEYGAKGAFEFAVVISDLPNGPIPPCGICLQFFKEFVDEDFPIYLGDETSVKKQFSLGDFLPHSFSSQWLPEKP